MRPLVQDIRQHVGTAAGRAGFQYHAHADTHDHPTEDTGEQHFITQLDKVLEESGPVFCEIFTDTTQVWEPKSSTKRLEDGTLVSPPLEDLAPFLPREELKKQMFIPLLDEE